MLLEYLSQILDEESWQELEDALGSPVTDEQIEAYKRTCEMNGWMVPKS